MSAGPLCVVVSITNLREITHAYGSHLALTVRHVVLERAREFCRSSGGIAVQSGDQILLVFDSPVRGAGAELVSAQVGRVFGRILAELGDEPVEVESEAILVALSAETVEQADGAVVTVNVGAARLMREERQWRERFLADMKDAAQLFNALRTDDLVIDPEPVCSLHNSSVVSYYALVPFLNRYGIRRRVSDLLPPLERLGLDRRFARWSVEAAIDALLRNPGVSLACNVTAASASFDAWWAPVLPILAAQPEVAKRLVIELTEVSPVADIESTGRFVRELQLLGCRVGLDRVGGGNSSVEALMSLGVDIVKLDASCLHRGRKDASAADSMRRLVRFAGGGRAAVVLTGLEDEEDAVMAESAGATYVQGPRYRHFLIDLSLRSTNG